MIIKIKEISENALFESDGIKLRNMIMDFCNSNHDEKIQLDFSGITLFATMFFNAWVGYFVKNNREDILNKIEAINISKLGGLCTIIATTDFCAIFFQCFFFICIFAERNNIPLHFLLYFTT